MIRSVSAATPPAWPAGWEDAEVVHGVLVDEPAPVARAKPRSAPAAHEPELYDRFGRRVAPAPGQRCGRLVSVVG